MNRRAVALAADSATTVQYWADGQRKERYFKGANKIFNLSKTQPVGLMTYDSANLQGVPWEVLIKAYRDELGNNSYPTVEEYAENLFLFIERNNALYPHEFQIKKFYSEATDTAGLLIFITMNNDKVKSAKDARARKREADKISNRFLAEIKKGKYIGNTKPEYVDEAVKEHIDEVKKSLEEFSLYIDNKSLFDLNHLAEVGIRGVFSTVIPNSETTGVLVAGFGNADYFPTSQEYMCYGNILGRFVYNHGNCHKISQENISEIIPLAQADMVKTFIYGISTDAIKFFDKQFVKSLDDFCDKLEKAGSLANRKNLEDHVAQVKEAFTDAILGNMVQTHSRPLREVVGMLPIEDLADLAETLISIESLKERVTKDSESVSGPVDVAVISKSDGFIWIKRKHYFDRDLNPRYFQRIGRS